jgi:hypothetical protein
VARRGAACLTLLGQYIRRDLGMGAAMAAFRRSVTLSALGARGRTPTAPRRRGPRRADPQGAGRRRTRSRRRATGSPATAGPS